MSKVLRGLCIFLIICFAGCTDSKVTLVKKGVLEIDKGLTVGEAIDNFKYFKERKWQSFKADNGRDIVEVAGTVDFEKEPAGEVMKKDGINKVDVVFQFSVNKDNTFQVYASGFRMTGKDGKTNESTDDNVFIVLKALKSIYNNEPLLNGYLEKARNAYNETARSYINTLRTAMEASYADNEAYPDELKDILGVETSSETVSAYIVKTGDKNSYIIFCFHNDVDTGYFTNSDYSDIKEDSKENIMAFLKDYKEVERRGNLAIIEKN